MCIRDSGNLLHTVLCVQPLESSNPVLLYKQALTTRVRCAVQQGEVCVATKTRHLNWLGQLGEQDGNADSKQESNTDAHSARKKAQAAQQAKVKPGEKAPQSKEQSSR